MTETMLSFLQELSRNVRIVDAIDILLVSIFIYAMLLWFRHTAARGLWIGAAALACLYFMARALDMYLTSLAFHTSFAALIFILVVIFQEDLRRLLERLAAIGSLHRWPPIKESELDLDVLVETVYQMARQKTGALIIIQGREPLRRHLHDGVALDGRLSEPLLLSIFDPSSMGHDGAVVVENGRIQQFAAHLPISRNSQQIAGRGTRHSAALGLSECSDAMIIVVSEERGTVGVAKDGVMQQIPTASELKSRLKDFLDAIHPRVKPTFWKRVVVQHGPLKVVSLVLAVIAWFLLAYDSQIIQRPFNVSIEYRNLPASLELDRAAPTEARVTLSGYERDFRFLDPTTLKLTFDLAGAEAGYREIPISEKHIQMPPNLALYRIEPPVLRLYLDELTPHEQARDALDGEPLPQAPETTANEAS